MHHSLVNYKFASDGIDEGRKEDAAMSLIDDGLEVILDLVAEINEYREKKVLHWKIIFLAKQKGNVETTILYISSSSSSLFFLLSILLQ